MGYFVAGPGFYPLSSDYTFAQGLCHCVTVSCAMLRGTQNTPAQEVQTTPTWRELLTRDSVYVGERHTQIYYVDRGCRLQLVKLAKFYRTPENKACLLSQHLLSYPGCKSLGVTMCADLVGPGARGCVYMLIFKMRRVPCPPWAFTGAFWFSLSNT